MIIVLFIMTALVCGVFGLTLLASAMRKEPTGELQCGQCGYDMSALSHERCPECGAAASLAKRAGKSPHERRPRLALAILGGLFTIAGLFSAALVLMWLWVFHILGVKG